ncbi:MAG: hypothetical protein U1F48_08250 [Burkholderiales bacterium]
MSLLLIGFLAIHVVVGALIAKVLLHLARSYGKTGWKVTFPIVVGSYLLVFWDAVPTALVHEYLCRSEAGVTVYKDAKEWVAEHPEEAAHVRPFAGEASFRTDDGPQGYWLNSRFYKMRFSRKLLVLPSYVNFELIQDAQTNSELVRSISISSGYRMPYGGGLTLGYLRAWARQDDCLTDYDQFTRQEGLYTAIGGDHK